MDWKCLEEMRNLSWILNVKKNLDKQEGKDNIQVREHVKIEKHKTYSVDPDFAN